MCINNVILIKSYFSFPLFLLFEVLMSCQTHSHLDKTKNRTSTYFACMYGMLYGTAWPDLQHESMVWYGMMASLPHTWHQLHSSQNPR